MSDHIEELCRREEVEFVFCSPEFSDRVKDCENVKEVFTFGPGPEGTVEARTLYEEDDESSEYGSGAAWTLSPDAACGLSRGMEADQQELRCGGGL